MDDDLNTADALTLFLNWCGRFVGWTPPTCCSAVAFGQRAFSMTQVLGFVDEEGRRAGPPGAGVEERAQARKDKNWRSDNRIRSCQYPDDNAAPCCAQGCAAFLWTLTVLLPQEARRRRFIFAPEGSAQKWVRKLAAVLWEGKTMTASPRRPDQPEGCRRGRAFAPSSGIGPSLPEIWSPSGRTTACLHTRDLSSVCG